MKNTIFSFVLLVFSVLAQAQHSFEVGAGWGNMGVSPALTWKPYSWSQGSRKEAAAMFSYRYVGEKKVYYAPSAKLYYGNNWSTSGSMNTMALHLGLAGVGVYLSKPMAAYTLEERKGKWFATAEINLAAISIGGNMTPNYGVRGANSGVRQWIDTSRVFGNQYYPLSGTYQSENKGRYSSFQYAIPVVIRFWNMITPKIGLGAFVSSNCLLLEKSLNLKGPWSVGYDIQAGVALVFFNNQKPTRK